MPVTEDGFYFLKRNSATMALVKAQFLQFLNEHFVIMLLI